MATVLEAASSGTVGGVSLSTTSYATLSSCQLFWQGTEPPVQIKRHAPGTLSGLYVRISANTITATSTYRIRKNTANGNQVVSVASGLTGEFNDPINTDSVAAADIINASVVTGGSGTSIKATVIAVQFAATTNTTQEFAAVGTGNFSVTTTQRFCSLPGGSDGGLDTAEADAQLKFRTAGTLAAIGAEIVSNTATTAVTVTSRINTAAGAQTFSVGSAGTGFFQDLANTDSISSGTLVALGFVVAAGGSGTCVISRPFVEFTSTNSQWEAAECAVSGLTQGLSVTGYYPWMGYGVVPGATAESDVQMKASGSYTASNLLTHIRSNTIAAASTVRFRKNAGNGNQSASVTSSTTGFFEDATNSDALLASDEVNYQFVSGGSGTSIQVDSIATLIAPPLGGLFLASLLNGLGAGGAFFRNPLG